MATPRVLVIDSDRPTIEQLREAIDKAGYDMEIALNAATAMTILEQRQMDAVILGLEVVELHEPKVVREIRRAAGSSPLIGIGLVTSAWEGKELVRAELQHWIERTAETRLNDELERVLPIFSARR